NSTKSSRFPLATRGKNSPLPSLLQLRDVPPFPRHACKRLARLLYDATQLFAAHAIALQQHVEDRIGQEILQLRLMTHRPHHRLLRCTLPRSPSSPRSAACTRRNWGVFVILIPM